MFTVLDLYRKNLLFLSEKIRPSSSSHTSGVQLDEAKNESQDLAENGGEFTLTEDFGIIH